MFLRQYTDLQIGNVNPISFRRAEITKQIYTLTYDTSVQLPPETFSTAAGAMDIDSSERFLLTGHQDGYWSIVDCWNTESHDNNNLTFKLIKRDHTPEKPRYSLSSVFWHIDSGMFSTCSWFGTVNIFDTNKTRKPLRIVGDPGFVEYVKHTVNPINQTLIAATNRIERNVGFIDLRIGSEIQILPSTTDSFVAAFRFSPANEYHICCGTDIGQVIEWDMRSPYRYLHCYQNKNLSASRCLETLPAAHRHNVSSLKYSEDGRHLYSYGVDKTMHKFCTNNAKLEETVVLDCAVPKMLQYLEIYVFENVENPLVLVPYNKCLYLANMAEGVGKVVAKIKCRYMVNGFQFNRTLLKGFSYGKTCTVFTTNTNSSQHEEEESLPNREDNRRQDILIDVSDL